MRCPLLYLLLTIGLGMALPAAAAEGRILKVLPELMDLKGRTSLAPSLYERDAYQAQLRLHPTRRSGIRFYIEWKIKGPAWERLTVRLELRGGAQGHPPRTLVLDTPVENTGDKFSHWVEVTLAGDEFKKFGGVSAWRASLWEGTRLLGQQESYLW